MSICLWRMNYFWDARQTWEALEWIRAMTPAVWSITTQWVGWCNLPKFGAVYAPKITSDLWLITPCSVSVLYKDLFHNILQRRWVISNQKWNKLFWNFRWRMYFHSLKFVWKLYLQIRHRRGCKTLMDCGQVMQYGIVYQSQVFGLMPDGNKHELTLLVVNYGISNTVVLDLHSLPLSQQTNLV